MTLATSLLRFVCYWVNEVLIVTLHTYTNNNYSTSYSRSEHSRGLDPGSPRLVVVGELTSGDAFRVIHCHKLVLFSVEVGSQAVLEPSV